MLRACGCAAGDWLRGGSALTKRALVDGDSESFTLKRLRVAGLGNSKDDVAVSKSGLPPGSMAHFPGKCRFCVNQKAERISKWEISPRK